MLPYTDGYLLHILFIMFKKPSRWKFIYKFYLDTDVKDGQMSVWYTNLFVTLTLQLLSNKLVCIICISYQ